LLREWDAMDEYISAMRTDSSDRAFYKAIQAVHKNQYARAHTHIIAARDLLDPELTSLIGESYGRSYTLSVIPESSLPCSPKM
jgi:serine/threonine-protein kinase mTOR